MKKKKIVHIVEAFGGGIFTFLVDLVNGTSDEFDITIIYALREQTPENFKKYFSKKVKFVQSKFLERQINIKNDLKAVKEVKKIIDEEKPDVIHMHSSKAGIIGRLAAKRKKIKLLYNPHGFSFLMSNISKTKRVFYWLVEKIASLKKCTIIACSYGELEHAKKITKNSICINNGLDIIKLNQEILKEEMKHPDIKNLKICTVGRINHQKNPELFNKIAENNVNRSFTWIGDGELKSELKSSNIKITGWKTRDEVIKLINDNDIFLLPSLWEGLPIALLEALYMKKICIVSNIIGNRDVIKDGVNGYVANNEEDYTRIIDSLDIEKINNITIEAQKDIIDNYNMESTIKQYKEIYNLYV